MITNVNIHQTSLVYWVIIIVVIVVLVIQNGWFAKLNAEHVRD